VEAFQPFPIEHRYGTTYSLSEADGRQLQRKLRRLSASQLVPVGMCRSHERRGLYLDQRDFDLFQKLFPEQSSIFLVVRRDNGAQATGGVFAWEGSDMRRHASYREFALGSLEDPAPAARPAATPVKWPRPKMPAFRIPDVRPFLLPATLALATGALPVIAYYTARGMASHRAAAPVREAAPAHDV